jgi:uncharacterized Fe-S cluster protein YjdI/CDGSH-type Zn-finger protein
MVQRSYSSDTITVHWNSDLCIHAAMCLNGLPEVFDVQRRPWISADAASADRIAQVVEWCPTGALTYARLDGVPGEQPPEKTTVVPWPNGPLMVTGNVELRDSRGELFTSGARFTLCRCGASRNQPFCDLSHREVGFSDNPRALADRRDAAESPQDISTETGP